MKKRVLSLVLCLVMLAGMLPVSAIDGGAISNYNPRGFKTMVLPRSVWENRAYMMGHDLRLSKANYVSRMTDGKKALSTEEDYADLEGSYTVNLDDSTIRECIRDDAGLRYALGVRMRGGSYWQGTEPPHTEVTLNQLMPRSSYNLNQYISLGVYQNTKGTLPLWEDRLQLNAVTYKPDWTNGVTRTKDLAVYLFDDKHPTVLQCDIDVLSKDGETLSRVDYIRPGDELQFTLVFSEYIRFCDGNAGLHEPKLEFILRPLVDSAAEDLVLYADYYMLDGNKIRFRHKVPAFYPNYEGVRDFRLQKIPQLEKNRDFAAPAEGLPLKLLPEQDFNTMETGALTTTCLITDLAGNPVIPDPTHSTGNGGIGFYPLGCAFDMAAPEVTGLQLQRSPLRMDETGKPLPYVRSGDLLDFFVYLSEPVFAETGEAAAVLNLKNADGSPVTVRNIEAAAGRNFLHFQTRVEPGMTLEAVTPAGGKPYSGVTVTRLDGSAVRDKAGYTCGVVDLPAKGVYSDTECRPDSLPPVLSVRNAAGEKALWEDGGSILPLSGQQFGEKQNIFCVPVHISDPAPTGTSASGIDGQTGYFWLDSRFTPDYDFYISADGSLTDVQLEPLWKSSRTDDGAFPLYSGKPEDVYNTYLYVRLPEQELPDPVLYVTAQDAIGNSITRLGEVRHSVDLSGPAAEPASAVQVSAGRGSSFDLSQEIVFRDGGGVNVDSFSVSEATGAFAGLGLGSHPAEGVDVLLKRRDPTSATFVLVWKGHRAGESVDTHITYAVSDLHGNETAEEVPFVRSLTADAFVQDVSPASGDQGYIRRLQLTVKQSENANMKNLLLLEDPGQPGLYAVAELDASSAGADLSKPSLYQMYRLTDSGSHLQNGLLLESAPAESAAFVPQLFGAYYGDVSYLLIAGEGVTPAMFTADEKIQTPVSVRSMTRRVADFAFSDSMRPDDLVPGFTAEPLGWSFRPEALELNGDKLEYASGSYPAGDTLPATVDASLQNKSLRVTLTRPDHPAFDWADVDELVLRIRRMEGYTAAETVFEAALVPTEQPQVVLLTDAVEQALTEGWANFQISVWTRHKFPTYASSNGYLENRDWISNPEFLLCAHRGWDYLKEIHTVGRIENADRTGNLADLQHTRSFSSPQDGESTVLPLAYASEVAYDSRLLFGRESVGTLDGTAFVRIWKQGADVSADDAARQAAHWYPVGTGLGGASCRFADLFAGESGLVAMNYQCFNAVDGLSPVRTLTFDVTEQPPTLELTFTPDPAEGFAKARTLRVARAEDRNGLPLPVYQHTGKDAYGTDTFRQLTPGEEIRITTTDVLGFYTVDASGGFASQTIVPPKMDLAAPTVSAEVQGTGDAVLFQVRDEFIDISTFPHTFQLKYNDAAYTEKLKAYGLQTDAEGWFTIPEAFTNGLPRYPDGRFGVAEQTVTVSDAAKASVQLQLAAPKGSGGYTGTVSARYTDSQGRLSPVATSPALTVPEMKLEAVFCTDPIFTLDFNYPVALVDLHPLDVHQTKFSYPAVSTKIVPYGTYTKTRMGVPVYAPGEQTVTVKDLFGEVHTLSYTVPESVFNGTQMEITAIRDEEGETPVVRVQLKSLSGNEFRIRELADYDFAEGSALSQQIRPGQGRITLPDGTAGEFWEHYTEAQLTVTANGAFVILADTDRSGYEEFLISVYDDRGPAELEVVWNYPNGLLTDADGAPYTEGYATAVAVPLDPTRSVVSGGTCTFTSSDKVGTEKTMTVTDDAGMVQTLRVKLETAIRKGFVPADPPVLQAKIFALRDGKAEALGTLQDNSNYQLQLAKYGAAQRYTISASADTPLSCKAVLLPYQADVSALTYAGAQNASLNGVTAEGSVVTVTAPDAKFSLVLVDERDQKSRRLDFDGGFVIDSTPPTVKIDREPLGYTGVRLTLTVTDDRSRFEEITVVSPMGVRRENGKFVFTASENKNFLFVVKDRCGNLTTAGAEVTEVDTEAPEASIRAYSPSLETDPLSPPAVTNRDVSIYVSFSKAVKALNLEIWDPETDAPRVVPEGQEDFVSVYRESQTSARVVFSENTMACLSYTALNGLSGKPLDLYVDCIDRNPPVLTSKVTYHNRKGASNPYSATVRITPVEDPDNWEEETGVAFFAGQEYTEARPFEQEITENGSYSFSFTDRAGNPAVVPVTVDQLDLKPPVLTVSDVPEGRGTFKLHANKPVTLKLPPGLSGDKRISGAEGGTAVITVSRPGFYLIRAKDDAGAVTQCYVSVGTGDETPPTLLQKSDYVYVRQGTAAAQLTDSVLLEGLRAVDDKTAAEAIVFTVDRAGLPADLSAVGTYPYTVTAADESGNTASCRRFLSIYGKNLTAVTVNGDFAKHTGVISTVPGTHAIHVSLPEGSIGNGQHEPYKVYCAKGFYTVGEMKPFLHPLPVTGTADGTDDLYTYDFTEHGWYTIYVVRQNREAFLTHLLVQ